MKTQFKSLFSAVAFLLAGTLACLPVDMAIAQSMAQSDAEEVPGDNFSLEGALELFKKSASPQEFEQLLNSPDSKVNNLDLNGDGDIDYIRVTDRTEGNVHTFTLSAVVSANESQDIAVIELEKRGNGKAVLQIVGDADIYGIETIIEPTEEVRVNAGTTTTRTIVNVWAWPSVQYVYGPYYSVWASPWYWGYYPGWYRPWRPVVWAVYNPFWAPYRPYYSVCFRHRIVYAPAIYRPYRSTAVVVHNRYNTQINSFRNTSHGYRYDRGGDYARGAHGNRYQQHGGTRTSYSNSSPSRSSYSNDQRSSYSNDRSGRTTRPADNTWSNRNRDSYQRSNDINRSSDGNRTSQRSHSNDQMSHNFDRSNGGNSGNGGRAYTAPQRQQYQAPQNHSFQVPQRQSTPAQTHSVPQQHRSFSPPSGGHSGGHTGGGHTGGHTGGGGSGGGHGGRRH